MNVNVIVGLLAIVGCVVVVEAYSGGPPNTVCTTMTPNQQAHGTAQNTASPYTVTTSKSTYMPNEMITVTVSSPNNRGFKGVFVQARLTNGQNTNTQGTFMLNTGENELRLMNCGNRQNSAVSHRSSVMKTTKTFKWKAPAMSVGTVRFRATFVSNKTTFWEGVVSADLRVNTTVNPGSGSSTVTCQGILLVALLGLASFLQTIL